MYIPKPYFSDVPDFGDLVFEYCFVDDGYPLLFLCRNNQRLYICVCRTIKPEQKWVISEVNIDIILRMLRREISVYDAFKLLDKKSCIVKWSKEKPVEDYNILQTCELSDSELPKPSYYISEYDVEDAIKSMEELRKELESCK